MKRMVKSSEQKCFLVRYIDRNDRSAQDRVSAENAKEAEKQVKKRAYRILDVQEITE